MSLASRYEQLVVDRNVYLDRARSAAKLTIPTLFPPDGSSSGNNFPTPWQSMGARCVNNLAAKLLLALFPPNAPFFKLQLDDYAIEKMTQQQGMRAEVEKALNKIERAVTTEIETTTSRPSLFELLKQLIVGGNALLVVEPKSNKLRVHKLTQYVCKRDPAGHELEIIVKECISALELPEPLRTQLGKAASAGDEKAKDDIDLYTGYKLVQHGGQPQWRVWQEIDGKVLPGSGHFPRDKSPARAIRWTALDGEDYGRGMCEEYLGDLKSLEGLQKALVQGAAAAAKVLFLVRPNSTTSKAALTKSESGEVHSGHADDVSVVQMEKFGDFRTALETRNDLIQSLSFAFMLNSAIQRNGERVTAEEIRYMAQELEQGLGGVYSTLSQDLQLPLVTILMSNMERQQRLPSLPKGTVKPAITTGIEAIGRGQDIDRLTGFAQTISAVLGPETTARYLNVPDFIKRVATAKQLDQAGLVKDEATVQQEAQQAQMAALAQRAAPNVVNKMGDAMMAQQQGATPNG